MDVDVSVAGLHGGGALEGAVQGSSLLPVGGVLAHGVQSDSYE